MRYNIAIILGEPNSINLELLKKLLVTIPKKIRDKITIIGSRELINKQSKKLNLNPE